MTLISRAVRQASLLLQGTLSVDVGLDGVAAQVEAIADPGEAAAQARKLLSERRRALAEVDRHVRSLTATVKYLSEVQPYTEDGWAAAHESLSRDLEQDPRMGLLAWLDYWFGAAGRRRTEALRRLEESAPLPDSAEVLRSRAEVARRALEEPTVRYGFDFLGQGIAGLEFAGRRVPPRAERAELRFLAARLLLHEAAAPDQRNLRDVWLGQVEELLQPSERSAGAATTMALRARLLRARGEAEAALQLVRDARAADPVDLDALVETVFLGRADDGSGGGLSLDAARELVDTLPTLVDVVAHLARLVDIPAELWLALAERAQREQQREQARDFAARGGAANDADGPLRARLAELGAEVAESSLTRRKLLRSAGDIWSDAEQWEPARRDFEEAGAGDAVDAEDAAERDQALVRQANLAGYLASSLPFPEARHELVRSLDEVLDVSRRLDVTGADSWCLRVEAANRIWQAAESEAAVREQRWQTLLAAARVTALAPLDPESWWFLGDVAQIFNLYQFGLAAVRRASALLPAATSTLRPSEARALEARENLARALVNVGRSTEALEQLEPVESDWGQCVKGCVQAEAGAYAKALEYFTRVTIQPRWFWAWNRYVACLVLTGRVEEAQTRARSFAEALRREAGTTSQSTWAALLSAVIEGRFEGVAEDYRFLAEEARTKGSSAGTVLGEYLILRGDPEGVRVLRDAFRDTDDPNDFSDWENVDRPRILALAALGGVAEPRLDEVDAVIRERLAALVGLDARAELHAVAREIEGPGREEAVAMLTALLRSCLDDPLVDDPPVDTIPGWSAERESLLAFHGKRVLTRRFLRTGEGAAAEALLKELLDAYPTQLDDLLRFETGGDVPPWVGNTLRSLVTDARYGSPARGTLDWLGFDVPSEAEAEVEAMESESSPWITLHLSRAWFEDYEDPVIQHPLFLRFLPEMRVRNDWEVPRIRVSVSEYDLEPGEFLVMVGEDRLCSGRVAEDRRYCPGATLSLLPDSVRATAEQGPHGWSVSAAEGDPLALLLTSCPEEVLLDVLARTARLYFDALATPST